MAEKEKCCGLCSLRTGTLILLWIVMIGCGFHILYINFDQTLFGKRDNKESTTQAKNNECHKKPSSDTPKHHSHHIAKEAPNRIDDASRKLGQLSQDGISTLTNSEDSKNGDNNSYDSLFKRYIPYFILVWGILGVSSSALGIYGIHRNDPKFLSFSIYFFYISFVFEFLLMSEINVDSEMKRKVFLASELVRIDWKDILENSIILVDFGILFISALTFFFLTVVRNLQLSMLERKFLEEINSETEVIPMDVIVPNFQPNIYFHALPPYIQK